MFKGLLTEGGYFPIGQKQSLFDGVMDIKVAETLDEEYLAREVRQKDALLVVLAPITRKVIEAGENLKVIGRFGAGVDNIDLEAATERRIVVVNIPRYHLPSTSEHALALIFALARNIPACDKSVKSGQWTPGKFVGTDIEGKTLGILGLGQIGSLLARKALSLGMKVIGHDPHLTAEQIGIESLQIKDFESIVAESDFLSIHVPMTPETAHLIDANILNRMKETAYLINISRGRIVDEDALYDALANQRIAGAAIDVMAKEPPGPNHKFYGLENIIITPHIGGNTVESGERARQTFAKNVLDVLQGEKPEVACNPEVFTKLNLKGKL